MGLCNLSSGVNGAMYVCLYSIDPLLFEVLADEVDPIAGSQRVVWVT